MSNKAETKIRDFVVFVVFLYFFFKLVQIFYSQSQSEKIKWFTGDVGVEKEADKILYNSAFTTGFCSHR